METPVQIDFHGLEPSEAVRQNLRQHLAALERRFGRITAGRLVVTAPGGHHRSGGLYRIAIHLSLPDGKSVNVDRVNQADERYSDLAYALNDSFKRARRQLQDQVRRLQGKVKQHEAMPVATVVRIDPSGEFGFLATADEDEIYFHKNSVLDGGFGRLKPGSRVSFAAAMGDKGPAGEHGPAPRPARGAVSAIRPPLAPARQG